MRQTRRLHGTQSCPAFSWHKSLPKRKGENGIPSHVTPSTWQGPNNGRGKPIPGPRIIGQLGSAGLSLRGDRRLATVARGFHAHVPPREPPPRGAARAREAAARAALAAAVSTGDRALMMFDEEAAAAEAARAEQMAEKAKLLEAKESFKQRRKRYKKEIYFRWNRQKLCEVYQYEYKKHKIALHSYYGSTKKEASMLNWNIASSKWHGMRHSYVPNYYNRYENPSILGKDCMAVEEGDVKYGQGGKFHGFDPFIRDGPITQLHDNIRLEGKQYLDDAWHFHPAGVNRDLGKWAQRPAVRQNIYHTLRKHTIWGKNLFYSNIGALGFYKMKQRNWLQGLLAQPVPRIGKFQGGAPVPGQGCGEFQLPPRVGASLRDVTRRGREQRRQLARDHSLTRWAPLWGQAPFQREGAAGGLRDPAFSVSFAACRMERPEYR